MINAKSFIPTFPHKYTSTAALRTRFDTMIISNTNPTMVSTTKMSSSQNISPSFVPFPAPHDTSFVHFPTPHDTITSVIRHYSNSFINTEIQTVPTIVYSSSIESISSSKFYNVSPTPTQSLNRSELLSSFCNKASSIKSSALNTISSSILEKVSPSSRYYNISVSIISSSDVTKSSLRPQHKATETIQNTISSSQITIVQPTTLENFSPSRYSLIISSSIAKGSTTSKKDTEEILKDAYAGLNKDKNKV